MDSTTPQAPRQAPAVGPTGISARRKTEVILRLLEGEPAAALAAEMHVSPRELENWRREFVLAGERRMGELPLGIIERCLSPFERLVPLATLVSVAIGVVIFVQSQRREHELRDKEAAREREQRITEAFNALDDKYIDYVKLCLQHPELDVFDTPLPAADHPPATAAQRRQEAMMFAILLSVFERSYLMYRDKADPFKREQWAGWEQYMRNWLGRANFVAEYQRTKQEFDPAFVGFIDGLLARKTGER
jgi:hypothetical protein